MTHHEHNRNPYDTDYTVLQFSIQVAYQGTGGGKDSIQKNNQAMM